MKPLENTCRRMTAAEVVATVVQRTTQGLEHRLATLGLSTGETALALGVSEPTVKRWCNNGRLQCIRTPGQHRIIKAESVARMSQGLGVTEQANKETV